MRVLLHSTITVLTLMICSTFVQAQSISIPDTLEGWDQSWIASLNGSQATYSNWSQGGISSVSGTGSSVFSVIYQQGQFSYGLRTDFKYGQARIKGEGIRKTDDVISIRNRFNYAFQEDGALSGYGSVSFRTQFDRGYEYATEEGEPDILISNFFAPAYLSEGIGIAYDPSPAFTFEIGLGLKQTFVTNDSLVTDYGISEGKNFRSEGGLTTGINFEKEVFEDIYYTSTLETFTNFLIPVKETDVLWANELVGQINRLVSATFQFELRYDNDYSSEVQLKQVLSAGVSVNLY